MRPKGPVFIKIWAGETDRVYSNEVEGASQAFNGSVVDSLAILFFLPGRCFTFQQVSGGGCGALLLVGVYH